MKTLCKICGKLVSKKNILRHVDNLMVTQILPVTYLTRKMVEYSLVLPRFLREKKNLMNTLLRFEQEGEHLHQIFNTLENRYISVFNKPNRYWLMLESYENKLY